MWMTPAKFHINFSNIHRRVASASFGTFEKNRKNDFHTFVMDCRVISLSVLEWNTSLESVNNTAFLKMNLDELCYLY
jgi:hypothetical protein